MKKILFIILVSFLVIMPVSAQTNNNQISTENKYEENYNLIMQADKIQKYIKEEYKIIKTYSSQYPDYYGGIYISDDVKYIIIQIVKDNIPSPSTKEYGIYTKIVNYSDKIKIEYVDNTFNELNNINNAVSEYISSKKTHELVIGGYIDVMNNKSVVEMTEINDDNKKIFKDEIKNFKSNLNENAIYFKESTKAKVTATTLKAGAEIWITSGNSNGTCSMGFRVRYNNSDGYVTAGHCIKNATFMYTGTPSFSYFDNNQYYDYGFVATNSSYTPSNSLAFPDGDIKTLAVVNYCPTITTNMEVAKSGKTTEYTDGKVKGLNQTITYDMDDGSEMVIKGLVTTDLKADDGDSGAPVFIPRTDAQGGSIPLGVVSGKKDGILGIGRRMYFTDITDMVSGIQLGRY